jgi:hypothetical protein
MLYDQVVTPSLNAVCLSGNIKFYRWSRAILTALLVFKMTLLKLVVATHLAFFFFVKIPFV